MTDTDTLAPVATADVFRSLLQWADNRHAYARERLELRPSARHGIAWRISPSLVWTDTPHDKHNGHHLAATLDPDAGTFIVHRYANREQWENGGPAWRLVVDWGDRWDGSRYISPWSTLSDAAREHVTAEACRGALAFLADDGTNDERAAALAKWRRENNDRIDKMRADLVTLLERVEMLSDDVNAATLDTETLPHVPYVRLPWPDEVRKLAE